MQGIVTIVDAVTITVATPTACMLVIVQVVRVMIVQIVFAAILVKTVSEALTAMVMDF